MDHPDYWQRYRTAITQGIEQLQVTTGDQSPVETEKSFQLLCDWTGEVRNNDGSLHLVGNGASACFASHMAVDWTKNAGVRALVYNDIASLTAVGNDLGYDRVFADPLKWYGRTGDLLVTVSSSGNSSSIVNAIAAARALDLRIVTFSGMKPDNKSRKGGDLNFFVPGWSYGLVECAHQVLLHAWLDRFMNVCEWNMDRPQFT